MLNSNIISKNAFYLFLLILLSNYLTRILLVYYFRALERIVMSDFVARTNCRFHHLITTTTIGDFTITPHKVRKFDETIQLRGSRSALTKIKRTLFQPKRVQRSDYLLPLSTCWWLGRRFPLSRDIRRCHSLQQHKLDC